MINLILFIIGFGITAAIVLLFAILIMEFTMITITKIYVKRWFTIAGICGIVGGFISIIIF